MACDIQIQINGESRTVDRGTLVSDLVHELELSQHAIAVELNLEILTQERYSQTALMDGDVLEIVTLVGGG